MYSCQINKDNLLSGKQVKPALPERSERKAVDSGSGITVITIYRLHFVCRAGNRQKPGIGVKNGLIDMPELIYSALKQFLWIVTPCRFCLVGRCHFLVLMGIRVCLAFFRLAFCRKVGRFFLWCLVRHLLFHLFHHFDLHFSFHRHACLHLAHFFPCPRSTSCRRRSPRRFLSALAFCFLASALRAYAPARASAPANAPDKIITANNFFIYPSGFSAHAHVKLF